MKNKYIFVAVMLTVLLVICFGATNLYVSLSQPEINENNTEEDFVVVTSFYPMYIAAMNVIGDTDSVTLQNLSEPQTGCLHDFQLTPEDMKLLSTADVFVINGGGIEGFMETIAKQYPKLTIVDATKDLELLCEDHEHETESYNPHAWLSVELYQQQVENIAQGLAEADASHGAGYLANKDTYVAKMSELQQLQEEIRQLYAGQDAIMFHCGFDYLAADYGMEVAYCMDLDEERQVSAGEVAQVIEIIRNHKVQYIFAEARYATEMCNLIQQEVEVEVIYLDPLTRGEYDPDAYIDGMRANMLKLRKGDTP